MGYLFRISFLGYNLKSYPDFQKISYNILSYPIISYHIHKYPKISAGANSQMVLGSLGCGWLCICNVHARCARTRCNPMLTTEMSICTKTKLVESEQSCSILARNLKKAHVGVSRSCEKSKSKVRSPIDWSMWIWLQEPTSLMMLCLH